MSGFVPISFPQSMGRAGGKGPDGAAGAAGPAGAAGANGAAGAVSITTIDLSQAELAAMNTTPISITADANGMIQLPLFAFLEFNKTVAGAANPSLRIRWRGTATEAVAAGTIGLTTAEIAYFVRTPASLTNNQAGAGLPVPFEGLGLEATFSISPGGVFQATGRISVAILSVPAVIS